MGASLLSQSPESRAKENRVTSSCVIFIFHGFRLALFHVSTKRTSAATSSDVNRGFSPLSDETICSRFRRSVFERAVLILAFTFMAVMMQAIILCTIAASKKIDAARRSEGLEEWQREGTLKILPTCFRCRIVNYSGVPGEFAFGGKGEQVCQSRKLRTEREFVTLPTPPS